ncbi:hypothetical protein [Streptomyces uncialis]|uniref:hypothetical protein n=1 Tax=Streptomyces uncialis TaxID=1048205 RepID=UPI00386BD2A3|nr:hypothetical protein OG924_12590 [Streptomyces uncialis]
MARVRYIGRDPVTVPELGPREIGPDEIVQVPDERFDGYVCQPHTWEPVEEPAAAAPAPPPPVKKTPTTAAKTAPKED